MSPIGVSIDHSCRLIHKVSRIGTSMNAVMISTAGDTKIAAHLRSLGPPSFAVATGAAGAACRVIVIVGRLTHRTCRGWPGPPTGPVPWPSPGRWSRRSRSRVAAGPTPSALHRPGRPGTAWRPALVDVGGQERVGEIVGVRVEVTGTAGQDAHGHQDVAHRRRSVFTAGLPVQPAQELPGCFLLGRLCLLVDDGEPGVR